MEIKILGIDKLELSNLVKKLRNENVDLNGVRVTAQVKGFRYIKGKEIYANFRITTNKQPVTFTKENNPDFETTVLLKFDVPSVDLNDFFTEDTLTDLGFISDPNRPNIYNSSNLELIDSVFDSLYSNTYDLNFELLTEEDFNYANHEFTKIGFK